MFTFSVFVFSVSYQELDAYEPPVESTLTVSVIELNEWNQIISGR
jgi:hypothetical protein